MLFDGHSTGATPVIVLTNPSLYQAGSEVLPLSDPSENAIPTVVFPASGEDDEPLDEVAAAAALLQGEVRIVATGRLPAELAASALELSGFLPDAEFEALMVSASAVLALTTREATNQRSAAEAIERGLPLVCSDTQMLRATYGRAAVMVPNTGDGIAAGVHEALQRRRELHDSAIDLRAELIAEANRAIEQLGAALS
jgi:glycosyltransferase involved in cell wall biosynthesis